MRPAYRIALGLLVFAAAVALMIVLPHWLSDFRASQFARAGTFFIAILGLIILTGYTGQISLGHGALMAVGAYTTAIVVADFGLRDVWTIPLAGLVAGFAGFIVGLPALRLRGLYLALVTFALAIATPLLLKKDICTGAADSERCLTGGTSGINVFEKSLNDLTGAATLKVTVFGHSFTQNDFFYYLTWSIGLLMFALAWLLLRGRFGRALRALRDSEVAAVSSGVRLSIYKTVAFAISGFYAGVAGSLYLLVSLNGFAVPTAFPFGLSLQILVGTVVAGVDWLPGAVFGALFLQFLPDFAERISKAPGVPFVVYGAAIILVMILLPRGLGGLARRAIDPLTARLYTRSH
jgi:branched-chain amino acid transport system permease protein